MTDKIKKITIINIVCGVGGELAALTYLSKIFPALNFKLIAASLLFVTGVLLIVNMCMLKSKASKERKLLFSAIIINPGLVSVTTSISMILTQNPELQQIGSLMGLLAAVAIIIGFGVFIAAIKNKGDNGSI